MVRQPRVALGFALGLALALAGCGGGGGGAVEATAGQTTGAGVPAQPTSNPAGTGDSGDSRGSGDSGGSGEPQTVVDPNGNAPGPSGKHTVAIGSTFQMPPLKGMDLQAAQDLLQGRNSYELEQKDATGRDRKLVKDTDWRVCKQIPASGKYVPVETRVVLFAVMDGERCP